MPIPAVLVKVRSTPGSTAPEESVTRPVMTPSCAQHGTVRNSINAAVTAILPKLLIHAPSTNRLMTQTNWWTVIYGLPGRVASNNASGRLALRGGPGQYAIGFRTARTA